MTTSRHFIVSLHTSFKGFGSTIEMAAAGNGAGNLQQREPSAEEAVDLESQPSKPSKMIKLSHPTDQQAATAQAISRSVRLEDVSHWTSLSRHAEFQMPSKLCSYSLDSQREQHHDDRQRKYYRDPIKADRTARDLNYGYDRYQTRENMGVSLENCLYSVKPWPDRESDLSSVLPVLLVVP